MSSHPLNNKINRTCSFTIHNLFVLRSGKLYRNRLLVSDYQRPCSGECLPIIVIILEASPLQQVAKE
jgi:hypothetical protein